MKFFLLLFAIFFSGYVASAQVLKKLGDKVKRDSEWRIRNKADQQVNKGLDSLIAMPKKASDKKKAEKNADKTTSTNTESKDNNTVAVNNNTSVKTKSAADENDMTPVDGFITLTLS